MTESKPIDKKLAQSDAFHSIKAEHTALNILNTHGWKPIHSPYYKDMISGKLRELDLAGRQIWCKNIGKHELIARIHIYVEIKSAPAFHIQGEIVNILLKIKNSFLPTKQILIGL
ncbi:hypothetical protein [Aeromonas allosaccharophila]|uniref:Uncharacterized protein n=1 Tax=Aeromonas allosaccharophila TaxID=656 RepID=A0A7T2PFX6_9GAMM|nr:hypothetical protein [Aeromonas allosaccharophila]QPR55038.1 hypothetical protein I6G90_00900 [Aeromonas allosaccharophila]